MSFWHGPQAQGNRTFMVVNASRRPPLPRVSRALRNRLLLLLAGNVVLLGAIWVLTLRQEQASFWAELARFPPNAAPYLLAGVGLSGIIFTGAIDLSIGGILVMAGTVFGILHHHGAAPGWCFAACFGTAVSLSAWNGWLVRLLRIPAIIVTLGGLTFYRGAALLLAGASIPGFAGQITIQGDAYHVPGCDGALYLLLGGLIVACVWELCGKTPRVWLALGSSHEACRLKGVNTDGVLLSAFAAGGIFLGLAALVSVTNQLTIEPARMARNFELYCIGAVVLGGTNIFGGEGTFLGTVLGGTFLYFVGQLMLYAGVSEFWRTALQGGVIVAVIGMDCWLHRRRQLLDELR